MDADGHVMDADGHGIFVKPCGGRWAAAEERKQEKQVSPTNGLVDKGALEGRKRVSHRAAISMSLWANNRDLPPPQFHLTRD